MKKIMALFLILFTSVTAFASNTTIKFDPSMSGQVFRWEFDKNDGMFFLLGPESDHSLVVRVDPYTSNGYQSDPATLFCNANQYRLEPNTSVTCYGNFADVIVLQIAPTDYKNGSKGTYAFEPLKK